MVSKTAFAEIEMETTSFIPDSYDAMVQILKIKNNSSQSKKLKLYNVNPVNIGDANEIQFYGYNTLTLGGAIIDREIQGIVWRTNYGIPFSDDNSKIKDMFGKVGVHTTSLENSSFSTKYEDFVGHYTRTMANPEAVEEGSALKNQDAQELTSSLSAIHNELLLSAGEEKEVIVVFAASSTEDYYCKDKKELKKFLAQVLEPANAWEMFETVKKEWHKELDKLQISVPKEPSLTPGFKWLQYQCAMVALLNRMKSRYH